MPSRNNASHKLLCSCLEAMCVIACETLKTLWGQNILALQHDDTAVLASHVFDTCWDVRS